jgi:hypothetical protein
MKRRGSILVFVLALIVLLSVLSTRLMEETVQELRHVSQFHRRDDLRMHAYSALDLTVGVLSEFQLLEGKLYAAGQGWGDPIGYSGLSPLDPSVRWSIRLTDETAKLSLAEISEKDLVNVFALMHSRGSSLLDEDDGQPYYDALMDWQDKDEDERDEGAEDDHYEGLQDPYFTPGRPLNNFEELRMIKGFAFDPYESEYTGLFYDESGNETDNMRDFQSSFSFFYDGPVNVNGLSAFLSRFLSGDDGSLHEDFLNGPSERGEPFYTNMSDPSLTRMMGKTGIPLGVTASVFRVEISIDKGRSNFLLHAVLGIESRKTSARRQPNPSQSSQRPRSQKNTSLKYPFRILSLRENENLID